MLRLNKISIEGYKSIRQCRDLKLENLNVLIGANGSGKSNLISFFALLNAAMRGELQVFIGSKGAAHSLLHFGPKVTKEFTANLEFDSETESNLYTARLLFAAPDNLVFAEETFRTTPKPGSTVKFSEMTTRGANESAVVHPGFRDNERLKFFARFLGGIRSYHFHDTSERADIRLSRRVEDNRRLYSNGENLASILRFLRDNHSNAYARIVETLRLVTPLFGEFILDSPSAMSGHVLLNWRAKGSDYELGPHQLSDGTLRFIALSALLLQPAELFPDVIVIDEPELGLHPFAIKILASLLQDASNFTQLIVATQSAALVDQMEPEDVIVLEIEDKATRLERLDREKLTAWLEKPRRNQ